MDNKNTRVNLALVFFGQIREMKMRFHSEGVKYWASEKNGPVSL